MFRRSLSQGRSVLKKQRFRDFLKQLAKDWRRSRLDNDLIKRLVKELGPPCAEMMFPTLTAAQIEDSIAEVLSAE